MERLDPFFGGRFHQDWPDDDISWRAVVARYRAEDVDAEASRVAEEIVRLIQHHADDGSLVAELNKLGCYRWPGSPDLYRAWLSEVADALRQV